MTPIIHRLLLVLLGACLLMNCSSTRNTSDPRVAAASKRLERTKDVSHADANEVRSDPLQRSNLDLTEMLRKVPGLAVTGAGTNARVTIRGASTINASNEPLYVLDGTPMGQNFNTIAGIIDPNEVQSIYVLKGADAAIYGVQGGNGVILFKLKK